MPVCARDTGIYLGFLSVLGLFVLGKRYERAKAPDRWVMGFAAIGLVAYVFDALSSYLGFRSTSNDIRLLVGLAFGAGITFLVLSVSSTVMFKARGEQRIFSLWDVPIIVAVLAALSIPFLTDLGVGAYYVEASLLIAGYLIMFFVIFALLFSILWSWSLADPATRNRLLVTAAGFEMIVIVALWVAKYFAWAVVSVPG
jgi:uncharacterized membrane protein